MDDKESPPIPAVRTLAEIPAETRQFLARLRPEDLQELEGMIHDRIFVKTLGRFGKWIALGVLAIAVGIVAMHESAMKILGWVRG
jgi:hypothetical protein